MSRWRYESVILKPSPIEIFATMIAFSPTRADAFSMLITTGDFESAAALGRPLHTTAVNATSVTTRRLTGRVPPPNRGLRPRRAGCRCGNRLAQALRRDTYCETAKTQITRSEEHTSELQSHSDLVCR